MIPTIRDYALFINRLKLFVVYSGCWGILELKWNGTKLIDAETMLEWAKQMTWKGLHPVVELSRQVYHKGISLGKAAMEAVEARLQRDPKLTKYDILIEPALTP
jgi:hypothetical protein